MKQISILKRLIGYGGLTGSIAKLYYTDKSKRKRFICEVAEQCCIGYSLKIWDRALIKDIMTFANQQKKDHEKISCKIKGDFRVS